MNTIFKTEVPVEGKNISYTVSFYEEAYHFTSVNGNGINFKIAREVDEWHTKDAVDDSIKNAATDALDKYLLSQH